MAEKLDVIYELQAKTEGFEKGLKKAKSEVEGLGNKIENTTKGIANNFAFAFTKIAATITAIVGAFKAIKSGVESLINIKQLEVVLKNAGIEGDKLSKTIKELREAAQELSKTTAVDDDDIIKMQRLGIQAGLTVEQTKELVKIAIDISKAFGMDLDTAMIQVTRTFQAGESILTRYDARLKALIESGASNAQIAKHLMETYGGLAKEISNVDIVSKFFLELQNLLKEFIITIYPLFSTLSGIITKILGLLQEGIKKTREFFDTFFKTYGLRSKESQLKSIEDELRKQFGYHKAYELFEKEKISFETLLKMSLGSEQELASLFGRLTRKLPEGAQLKTLDKIRSLLSEYRQAYLELEREQKRLQGKSEEAIKIDDKALKVVSSIKRVKSDLEQEKSITQEIMNRINIVKLLINIEKQKTQVSKENLEYIKRQVDELGNLEVANRKIVDLMAMSAKEIDTLEVTEKQKQDILNLALSFKELGDDVVELEKEPNREKSSMWGEDLDKIMSGVNGIVIGLHEFLKATDDIAMKFNEIATAASDVVVAVKDIKTADEVSFDSVLSAVSSSIMLIVKTINIVSGAIDAWSAKMDEVIDKHSKLTKELEKTKVNYEIILLYSERLVKFSKEYVELEKQRYEELVKQFNTLAEMLNLSKDFNNVDYESVRNRAAELQNEKERLENFKNLVEIAKKQTKTFLGINVISKEVWAYWAGVVNELHKMGKITEEQKNNFLDNFNVTEDMEAVLEILNKEIDKTSDLLSKVNEYLKLSNELSGYNLKYQEELLSYELELMQNEERIKELKGESTEKEIKKQIETLEKLKEIYKKQGDTLKIQRAEISILEKQKSLQEAINKTLDDRINKLREMVELGLIDIENWADVSKIVNDLVRQGVPRSDILKIMSELNVRAPWAVPVERKQMYNNIYINAYSVEQFQTFLERVRTFMFTFRGFS